MAAPKKRPPSGFPSTPSAKVEQEEVSSFLEEVADENLKEEDAKEEENVQTIFSTIHPETAPEVLEEIVPSGDAGPRFIEPVYEAPLPPLDMPMAEEPKPRQRRRNIPRFSQTVKQ